MNIMNLVKYPRTYHLPWSDGVTSDDKILKSVDSFLGRRVIVTEKMDGENTTIYSDYIHARSLDSSSGEDRAWVKQLQASIGYMIPENMRICGENLWAKHSIEYTDLESYFYGFSMWSSQYCLPYDDTIEWFELLGIHHVPVLYDGIFDIDIIKSLHTDSTTKEGYVVRLADTIHYDDFGSSVAKYVRANHVTTDKHWRHIAITKNGLKT